MKIDIKKYKCGDYCKDIFCPRCKPKEVMFILGSRKDKVGKTDWKLKFELECKKCMLSQWVDPDDFEFDYIPPKKRKEENEEGSYRLPPMPNPKKKKSNLKKR